VTSESVPRGKFGGLTPRGRRGKKKAVSKQCRCEVIKKIQRIRVPLCMTLGTSLKNRESRDSPYDPDRIRNHCFEKKETEKKVSRVLGYEGGD